MKIQLIKYTNSTSMGTEKDGIYISRLNAPRALDDFDVNIIDLSVKEMWSYKYSSCIGAVDSKPDLITIQQMVTNKKKSIVLYVLPQNIIYYYDTQYPSSYERQPLKDIMNGAYTNSITNAVPLGATMPNLAYENTRTTINGITYPADFYLSEFSHIITKSDKSEKATTVEIAENVYATTLDITRTIQAIKHYVSTLFEQHKREQAPVWMDGIIFNDDTEQREIITNNHKAIDEAKLRITQAEGQLEENAKYKSILYTNGNELVRVVFEILESILDYDLSSFEDILKEDFLIKKENITFIGEIKGVTSNVKNEHITQVECHYQSYQDVLTEKGIAENVKQILIMNPFRTKAIEQREPIHENQIKLAMRNGCLIIETSTLLRIFEQFIQGKVSSSKCISIFSTKTGLLRLDDISEENEDITPYMI